MARSVSHTSGCAVLRAAALLAAALAPAAGAQTSDAPRAPRIIGVPAPESAPPSPPAAQTTTPARLALGPLRPPSAARLAALPEERANTPDEIIVIGQGWRLPDLGSEWRERQREEARQQRFSATLLPLYDPARPPLRNDPLLGSREERRHGYIELFRLRFGRRPRD